MVSCFYITFHIDSRKTRLGILRFHVKSLNTLPTLGICIAPKNRQDDEENNFSYRSNYIDLQSRIENV